MQATGTAGGLDLFSFFTVSATALLIGTVVRIHLIGAIIVVCSIRRIIRVVLVRVVVELTTGMSIFGHAFTFAHNMISFQLIVFFIILISVPR